MIGFNKIISLLIPLLCFFEYGESQFYGADITYEQVGSNTYEIHLKILTEENVTLPDSLHKFSKTDSLNRCDSLKTYYFSRTETYPGGGFYWISFEDSTRNRIAINSPGLSEKYYCAAEVVHSSFSPEPQMSTVKFLDKPHLIVEKGDTLRYHPAISKEEPDSLFFELRQLDDSSGYWIPNDIEVNPKSGEFVWNDPDSIGLYEFTMEVKEYYGSYKGRVFRNFTVRVIDSLNSQGHFIEQGGFENNSNSYLERKMNPGETVDLDLKFVDSLADSVSIEAVGEPFSQASPTSFSISKNDSLVTSSFSWTPDSSHIRGWPYILTFIGKSYPSCIWHYKTVMVYVEDSTTSIEEEQRTKDKDGFTIRPNPAEDELFLSSSLDISEHELRILNAQGRIVKEVQLQPGQERIDVQDLDSGIYFLVVQGRDGRWQERFVKE